MHDTANTPFAVRYQAFWDNVTRCLDCHKYTSNVSAPQQTTFPDATTCQRDRLQTTLCRQAADSQWKHSRITLYMAATQQATISTRYTCTHTHSTISTAMFQTNCGSHLSVDIPSPFTLNMGILKKNNLDATNRRTFVQSETYHICRNFWKESFRRSCRGSSTIITWCRPISLPTGNFTVLRQHCSGSTTIYSSPPIVVKCLVSAY